MVAEHPDMHIMTARNTVATALFNRIKEDRPEEWAELERLAGEIRAAKAVDHSEQSPEVIQEYALESFRQLNC